MSTALQPLDGLIVDQPPPTASSSSQALKPGRVLACVLCSQRKVKCDRIFPCANCVRSRAQCVPSSQVQRARTRRIPQRILLERLRTYEDLLRQNNVAFEPLHKDSAREQGSSNVKRGFESDEEHPESMHSEMPTPSATPRSGRSYGVKNVWHVMSHGYRDPDTDSTSSHEDELESAVKDAWDQSVANDDNLLFGTRGPAVDLSNLHPLPVQIFRLWQVYLENVNPLLKVTHIPSLQGRIVEAVSDVSKISPTLEALMFSIYCTAIMSLAAEDCQRLFDSLKEDLLMRYQYGCQQALLNCSFLRTSDRECLTALYLYLISIRPSTVPQSLSSMLAVAIRIAQRMGIHSESALARYSALEAEMRRRLWWSLVLFDTRISATANSRTVTLDPTWDCRIPLNVNDSDLRPETKRPPPANQENPTEALFAVIRCELGEVIRHSSFHLDFTTPALKTTVGESGLGGEEAKLAKLEELIEDRYLKNCEPEHPLHFMTMWTTRAHLAKYRLLEHQSRHSGSSARQTDTQRDTATLYALRVLECDTKVMTSPLTKGFRWLSQAHFPFPAYIQIAQDLRSRPVSNKYAPRAWEVMSENYDAWFGSQNFREAHSPFFRLFANLILRAWEAYEDSPTRDEDTSIFTPLPPRVVSSIRHALSQISQHQHHHAQTSNADTDTDPKSNYFTGSEMITDEQCLMATSGPTPTLVGTSNQSLPYGNGIQDDDFTLLNPQMIDTDMWPGQEALGSYVDPWDWTGLDGQPGWEGF
ncbi:uncharacterized protein Z520_02581 [Fonsecaea multimorphosa CBS 102226]|uniref:Zn(2)-C6 fungal-type domain-containing protein n=1 Tax=Fonsecaea multimorphosa CBS 102226 TaxID=1442371 RepID=A0A0D2IZH1_9EURO|nr:uncharacterized protein Z520_02581 [Fonsecaea multimorphosa CBS 102226]KIY02442.1 hypothetical protein Z520_02581 [Fonsecaea multimorphosa CBS 102226]OAL29083.1 hypothetical protein AYO22_02520 [Fonsecaea multimorphosa]